MTGPSVKELQEMALRAFGRTLSEDEAWAFRRRLPGMAMVAGKLEGWAARLGEVEPAAVHLSPKGDGGDD